MRYAEYCQQLQHLKMSVDDIIQTLNSKPIRYALIIHDRDTLEDGSPKAPHIHIAIDLKGTSRTPQDLSLIHI